MTTEAEVYREAASLIRKHGWVQESDGNVVVGFCTESAVERAAEYNNVQVCFKRLFGLCGRLPFGWNDAPHRTVEDVLTLLEQAATEAEKEEAYGDSFPCGRRLERAKDTAEGQPEDGLKGRYPAVAS